MTGEGDVREATRLYRELSALLADIEEAVIAADTQKLSGLVPRQEELLEAVSRLELAEGAPQALLQELRDAAAEALRRNTRNALLLSEQLGLIQATMKAIIGDGRAIDRLA